MFLHLMMSVFSIDDKNNVSAKLYMIYLVEFFLNSHCLRKNNFIS